jgi:hypothetical protein
VRERPRSTDDPAVDDPAGRWCMNQIHANCFTPTR